jgi:hypothetical protein
MKNRKREAIDADRNARPIYELADSIKSAKIGAQCTECDRIEDARWVQADGSD